jgi:hypothetical protein
VRRKVKIIIRSSVFLFVILVSSPAFSAEEKISYGSLFDIDIKENHKALWKIFLDPEQDSGELLEDRRIRAVFVGRYGNFKDLFDEYAYSALSVYKSPFQAKILLIDYYFDRLVALKHLDSSDRLYLTISNFKKDYFNLYPHVYKKTPTSKKKAIIPNKLFQIEFFEDDRFIDAYQALFDAITEAVAVENVEESSLMPELLDKTSKMKLTRKSRFNFFKVEAKVDEKLLKEAFNEFFIEMNDLSDVISVTEFYRNKYLPKKKAWFTPLEERIISVSVLYDPDSDFDYYEMEYAKQSALLHEYFYFEGLTKERVPPLLKGGGAKKIEVQKLFNKTIYPDERLFYFEDDVSRDDYYRFVEEFYDGLGDVMDVTEEIVTTDDLLELEVLRLTATLDEIALAELVQTLKEEIKAFVPKPKDKTAKSEDDDDY